MRDGVSLWRGLLDFETEPLPPGIVDGFGIFPQHVLDNTNATLTDMSQERLAGMILALRTTFAIMAAEIGGVIEAILARQDERHPEGGDRSALMQTSMAGLPGRGHGDDPDRGGPPPPWRPRKCPGQHGEDVSTKDGELWSRM